MGRKALNFIKKALKYVFMIGSASLACGVAQQVTHDESRAERICAGITSIAAAGMLAEAVSDYSDRQLEALNDKIIKEIGEDEHD